MVNAEEIIKWAHLAGWRVYQDSDCFVPMPFCSKNIVRRVCFIPPNGVSGFYRNNILYVLKADRFYSKRYVTEVTKKNNRLIAAFRTNIDENVLAALDYST